jgi:hypothetical protein
MNRQQDLSSVLLIFFTLCFNSLAAPVPPFMPPPILAPMPSLGVLRAFQPPLPGPLPPLEILVDAPVPEGPPIFTNTGYEIFKSIIWAFVVSGFPAIAALVLSIYACYKTRADEKLVKELRSDPGRVASQDAEQVHLHEVTRLAGGGAGVGFIVRNQTQLSGESAYDLKLVDVCSNNDQDAPTPRFVATRIRPKEGRSLYFKVPEPKAWLGRLFWAGVDTWRLYKVHAFKREFYKGGWWKKPFTDDPLEENYRIYLLYGLAAPTAQAVSRRSASGRVTALSAAPAHTPTDDDARRNGCCLIVISCTPGRLTERVEWVVMAVPAIPLELGEPVCITQAIITAIDAIFKGSSIQDTAMIPTTFTLEEERNAPHPWYKGKRDFNASVGCFSFRIKVETLRYTYNEFDDVCTLTLGRVANCADASAPAGPGSSASRTGRFLEDVVRNQIPRAPQAGPSRIEQPSEGRRRRRSAPSQGERMSPRVTEYPAPLPPPQTCYSRPAFGTVVCMPPPSIITPRVYFAGPPRPTGVPAYGIPSLDGAHQTS